MTITTAALSLAILSACVPLQSAPEQQAPEQQVDEQQVDEQDKRLQDVYAKSKTAKSAADYGALIEACQALQKSKLNEKHVKYLTSLASWSHNRRGAIRLELSKQFLRVGNRDQAEQARRMSGDDFDAAIELCPTRWRAYLNRGAMLAEGLDYLSAINDFSSAIRLHPTESAGWFNRAELNYELKNYRLALEDYERVLEESPGDLQALTGQAHSLFQLGQFEESLRDYKAVLKMLPNNGWALTNRADVQQVLGNWQQAHEDYTQAVETQPVGSVYQRFAWLLSTCPDTDVFAPQIAREMAQKAIELDGENSTNLDTLATAYAANGEFDLAKAMQDRAIEMADGRNSVLEQRRAMFAKGEVFQQEIRRE